MLSDENKRKQYDKFGHAAFEQGGGGAGGFGGFGVIYHAWDIELGTQVAVKEYSTQPQ